VHPHAVLAASTFIAALAALDAAHEHRPRMRGARSPPGRPDRRKRRAGIQLAVVPGQRPRARVWCRLCTHVAADCGCSPPP
jgi:hypothetical protein